MTVDEGIVKLVTFRRAMSARGCWIGELFSHTQNNSPVTPIGGPR
jgi:hypothetical protein